MVPLRKYLYCLIRCSEERTFEVASISGGEAPVHMVGYGGLAAVVSDSPAATYPTTRSSMMAHEKVLEQVMQEFPLLPVRFGTVTEPASPVEDLRRLLQSRFDEFSRLLREMEGKVELGLKALWRDEQAIFSEILAENAEVRELVRSLSGKPAEAVRLSGIAVGRMVKEALEAKRGREAARILAPLRRLAVRVQENETLVDRMILNAAFLVNKTREPDFDQAVNRLSEEHGERIIFKYLGPTPPYNFVNIVVNWDELR